MEFIISKLFNQLNLSTGIMQVYSTDDLKSNVLSDEESIRIAIDIILNETASEISSYDNEDYIFPVYAVANQYNPSRNSEYAHEIQYIYDIVSKINY